MAISINKGIEIDPLFILSCDLYKQGRGRAQGPYPSPDIELSRSQCQVTKKPPLPRAKHPHILHHLVAIPARGIAGSLCRGKRPQHLEGHLASLSKSLKS